MTHALAQQTTQTALVADDEPGLPELYEAWLSDWDVLIARNGAEALDKFDDTVSLVLLDRRMPLASGDTVTTKIRERGGNCPIGMITASEPDVNILNLPLDYYVQKPVDRITFRNTVDQLLVRQLFSSCVREYFALSSKLVALNSSKNDREVRWSEAYKSATKRLEALHSEAETALSQMDDPQPILADLLREFSR